MKVFFCKGDGYYEILKDLYEILKSNVEVPLLDFIGFKAARERWGII